MAYASVASLIQTIDLVNYHHDDDSSISISISSRFKHQITSLHKHTSFLQSFLEDGDPNRAKNWEETIRDVADRAEEIIDVLVSDSLLKSSMSEVDGSVDELQKVTEEMESTIDRVKGRGIKLKAEPDEELMEIVSLLREGSTNLETISIFGEGGTGKSTPATNAYNHPLVTEHFDIRAWSTAGHVITVGHEYSGRDIILDLLRCLNIESVSDSDDGPTESMYTCLMGRRYLIVLHDIWTLQSFFEARRAFPDDGNGSRIMLSTFYYSLADSADHVHEMRLLDEDTTWNLLREKIFKGEPCPSQLEHYGRIIANGCRGHQLTIEMVSGILGADQTKAAWKDVSENIESVSDGDYVLSRIQSLSYTYLPHHLRTCFLYLGCFPGDQEIRVSKLIKLWVAEGFLNQSESKSFQETGEECLEDLVRRSLVSVSKRKCNGRIKSVKVHSHVRYMCLTQVHTGNFIYDDGRYGRFEQQFAAVQLQSCRLLSISNYRQDFLEGIYDSTIRTVILYSINNGEVGVRQSIGNVRLLRIVDLSNAHDYDLPEQVFQLFHLRFLAFHSGFSISKAISHLQNLQTLIVCPRENGRKLFFKLPESIWRMPQLRHLLNFSFNLPIPPL